MELTLPAGDQKSGVTLLEPATMSVEAAARVLGIGRQTAYELVRRGEIPVLRLGRRLLVPKVALERMLSESYQTQGGKEHDV